jgi:hypothetical protein
MESFQLASRDVYTLPNRPTCNEHRIVALSSAYEVTAEEDAAVQLERAGIRLAWVLNREKARRSRPRCRSDVPLTRA